MMKKIIKNTQILGSTTAEIIHFIKPYLPTHPVIIEAGGCEGSDSVQFAQAWPQGRIYTFEPIPALFIQLQEKVAPYKNVFAYPYALSDATGPSKMYISETYDNPGHTSGSSSLLRPLEHLFYLDSIRFVDEMQVESTTLDTWAQRESLNHVDFLWLDMQGSELLMLKESMLAKTATAIYIEVSFVESYRNQAQYKEVKEWMSAHGYTLLAADFEEALIEKNLEEKGQFFGNAFFVKTGS